ncbi:Histone-lysine N-methyltransferase ATX2 [Auxenochlorella protothecoides]|uniref:Histone-lysine N-methyltransferase ATX2 n=2 Tax=Auxenochlorella protothecoides TaxID=3075 RepID=A0A087SI79_AUXPR|nr:Histone-lysine N-methyltransferase ATX2 [Auxenochlorella protothecoides]KFM25433.1 Histone-lysine N-methyltransferase ATX2 [Auxenochlorella protothecoides]
MAGAEPSLARQREPLVVAGSEVVGRSLAIWSAQLMEWPKAVITGHDPATGRHAIKYRGRAGPETTETWVNLARTRFQWVGKPPPGAAPNPSAKSAPPDEALVGCRVKVFWPGMAKWYLGKVVGFDAKTRQHSIKYRDGDAQHLTLRHEAVQAYQRSRYTLARPSAFSRRQQSLSRLAAGSVAALGTLGRLCSTAVGGGAGTGTPRATDLPVRIYLSASSCSGDEGAQATLRALCGLAPAGSGAATHGRGGSDSPSSPERGVSLGASPGDSAGGQPAQRPSPFASPGQPALAGSDTEEEEEDALDQLRVAGLVKEEEELPQVLPQIPVGARSTAVAS